MQTEVVQVAGLVGGADPVEDSLVVEQRPVALAAGDQEDVRVGDLVEGRVGGDPEAARVGALLAGLLADEGQLRAGEAAEDLVGADCVEGGDLVENENGDFHAGIVAGGGAWRKWQKCPYALDSCQCRRAPIGSRHSASATSSPSTSVSRPRSSASPGPSATSSSPAPRRPAGSRRRPVSGSTARRPRGARPRRHDRRPGLSAIPDRCGQGRRALRRAAERGARVFSICTGAFALAHAASSTAAARRPTGSPPAARRIVPCDLGRALTSLYVEKRQLSSRRPGSAPGSTSACT